MDDQKSRKASDIILELESAVSQLLALAKAQDFNIKIMSNKLNMLIEQAKIQSPQSPQSITRQPSAEVIEETLPKYLTDSRANQVLTKPVEPLQVSNGDAVFSRTSRPDILEVKKPDKPIKPKQSTKISIQDPSPPPKEILEALARQNSMQPSNAAKQSGPMAQPALEEHEQEFVAFENLTKEQEKLSTVSVIQRVIDKSGKSVFLAEVNISDMQNNALHRIRTNALGKWQVALPPGEYKVTLHKREAVTKEKLESYQKIVINGDNGQQILSDLVLK